MRHLYYPACSVILGCVLVAPICVAKEGQNSHRVEVPVQGCTQIPSDMPDATVDEVLKYPEAVKCFGRTLRIECGELARAVTAEDLDSCKASVQPLFEFLLKEPATAALVDPNKAVVYQDRRECIAEMDGPKTKVRSCYWYVQARIALK